MTARTRANATARRRAARARRISCRRAREKAGLTGWSAHRSAAWWRRYYSKAAVARRKKAAAKKARARRVAARKRRREVRKLRREGYTIYNFPTRSNAWWNRYFAKLDREAKAACKPANAKHHARHHAKHKATSGRRRRSVPPYRPVGPLIATPAAKVARAARSRKAA